MTRWAWMAIMSRDWPRFIRTTAAVVGPTRSGWSRHNVDRIDPLGAGPRRDPRPHRRSRCARHRHATLIDGRFYYARVASVTDAGVQPVYSLRVIPTTTPSSPMASSATTPRPAHAAGDGDVARNRRGDSRLHPELRRPGAGADGPAEPVPEPAGQRLRRYRGRHGHQHPAAQPAGVGRSGLLGLDNHDADEEASWPPSWSGSRAPTSPPTD